MLKLWPNGGASTVRNRSIATIASVAVSALTAGDPLPATAQPAFQQFGPKDIAHLAHVHDNNNQYYRSMIMDVGKFSGVGTLGGVERSDVRVDMGEYGEVGCSNPALNGAKPGDEVRIEGVVGGAMTAAKAAEFNRAFQGISKAPPAKEAPSVSLITGTCVVRPVAGGSRSSAPVASTPAKAAIPQFRDHPAERFTGRRAPLQLTKTDMVFRTRLREAFAQPPNFAGHHVLALWGCGTSCLMGAAVDLQTGGVIWLPASICCWPADVDDKFKPVEFRLESKLIVLSGLRNEKEGDQGAHFYRLEGGRFVHVFDVPRDDPAP